MAHNWTFKQFKPSQVARGGSMAVWHCQNCERMMEIPNSTLHNTKAPSPNLLIRAETPEGVLKLNCEELQLLPVQIS
jgi:hypothetical protein